MNKYILKILNVVRDDGKNWSNGKTISQVPKNFKHRSDLPVGWRQRQGMVGVTVKYFLHVKWIFIIILKFLPLHIFELNWYWNIHYFMSKSCKLQEILVSCLIFVYYSEHFNYVLWSVSWEEWRYCGRAVRAVDECGCRGEVWGKKRCFLSISCI